MLLLKFVESKTSDGLSSYYSKVHQSWQSYPQISDEQISNR